MTWERKKEILAMEGGGKRGTFSNKKLRRGFCDWAPVCNYECDKSKVSFIRATRRAFKSLWFNPRRHHFSSSKNHTHVTRAKNSAFFISLSLYSIGYNGELHLEFKWIPALKWNPCRWFQASSITLDQIFRPFSEAWTIRNERVAPPSRGSFCHKGDFNVDFFIPEKILSLFYPFHPRVEVIKIVAIDHLLAPFPTANTNPTTTTTQTGVSSACLDGIFLE